MPPPRNLAAMKRMLSSTHLGKESGDEAVQPRKSAAKEKMEEDVKTKEKPQEEGVAEEDVPAADKRHSGHEEKEEKPQKTKEATEATEENPQKSREEVAAKEGVPATHKSSSGQEEEEDEEPQKATEKAQNVTEDNEDEMTTQEWGFIKQMEEEDEKMQKPGQYPEDGESSD